MEEYITLFLLGMFKEEVIRYLQKLETREPAMVLHDFVAIRVGEVIKIDSYPTLILTPVGWNKQSPELTYTEAEMIEIVYKYQANLFIEGDDPEELEFRAMRYKEAIVECLRDNYKIGGVALGSIVSSVDNYNMMQGETLEYGCRLNIDVVAPHSLSAFKLTKEE
jgi:hypothetical protein